MWKFKKLLFHRDHRFYFDHLQAALIGQMEKEKLLDQDNTCFVELGAGKGKFQNNQRS